MGRNFETLLSIVLLLSTHVAAQLTCAPSLIAVGSVVRSQLTKGSIQRPDGLFLPQQHLSIEPHFHFLWARFHRRGWWFHLRDCNCLQQRLCFFNQSPYFIRYRLLRNFSCNRWNDYRASSFRTISPVLLLTSLLPILLQPGLLPRPALMTKRAINLGVSG